MPIQRVIILLALIVGFLVVSPIVGELRTTATENDIIPGAIDVMGIAEEETPPEYRNAFAQFIGERFPNTAFALEKQFGIIFLQPVPSFGPFSPVGFNPAAVVCPVANASDLGGPYVGTHNDCRSCGSCSSLGGWQSENGTDWGASAGTPVVALVSGTVSGGGGCSGGFGPSGTYNEFRFYLCGDDGNAYYYTHLAPSPIPIQAGQRVAQGQVVGYLSTTGGGAVPHLHMGIAASFSCSQSSPPQDDPAIAVWDAWHNCCTSGGGTGCTTIDPGTLPPPGGGGGGGLPRPLPEPFTCEPADPATCLDPANSRNPSGYNQERCVPIDATCAQGTCFGLCTDDDGNVLTNVESLEGINTSSDPLGMILGLDPGGGLYCGYEVSDRCGDPAQGGACQFVLECETHNACGDSNGDGTFDACTVQAGRSLLPGEISCDSDADCRASHLACVNEQCVLLPEPGENECASSADCTFEDPAVRWKRTCILPDDNRFARAENAAGDNFYTQMPPSGTVNGPQCALVQCRAAEIAAGTCTSDCSTDTQCYAQAGISLIQPGEILTPSDTPGPCGDGSCDAGEDTSCPADCILRQDPLPPFPYGIGEGEEIPIATCSDTDGDAVYDACVVDGESTILCNSGSDCTRTFRSVCQGDQCVIVDGPGTNQCGNPASPTDTGALDSSLCNVDCTALDATTSCSVGTGHCSPEFQSQIWPAEEVCTASITCNHEGGGSDPFIINDSCLSGGSADYSIGPFQINLLAWCPQAFSRTGSPCVIGSQTVLNQCLTAWGYGDALLNSTRAYQDIWQTPNAWCHWSGARRCGIASRQDGSLCPL